MSSLAILGASGHGSVVADVAMSTKIWKKVLFFDDAYPTKNQRVIGNSLDLENNNNFDELLIAIGNNQVRLEKHIYFMERGVPMATLIHPSATISSSAKIGAGTVIMPGAVINANAYIGEACIINSNAVIEHDCVLHDGVHVSPGANVAGGVEIKELSWLGIGSTVIQNVTIGCRVNVGAGAVVINNLPDEITAIGIPARAMNS